MKICKYSLGMHRSSDIEGVFLMSDEELNMVKEIEGYEVYYGEISGKHSEVTCNLHLKDIEILSENPEEIKFFKKLFPSGVVGFSFKDYWFCDDKAGEDGWEEGNSSSYETAEEALVEYNHYNNSVMRKSFIDGFNQAREK